MTVRALNSLVKTTAFSLSAALMAAMAFASCPAMAQQGGAPAASGDGRDPRIPQSYTGPESAVIAVVNDKVITTYDVRQRMRLMILNAGGRINPQLLPQLQRQAVKDLVEEQLKIQEAKEFDLTATSEEIDSQVAGIAAQNGLSADQMKEKLEEDGVSVNSLRNQMAASIVWPRLVSGRYGKRVRVDDSEVDAVMQRLHDDATHEQFLLSEICIPVPSPDQQQAYYQASLQLIEQLRKGVPFAVIAQQFSACTTAAAGGNMGWTRTGELPPEIAAAVKILPVGAVTNPIPSEGAFKILAVRDKREAVKQGEKSWTLTYASAPLSVGRAAARSSLEKLATAEACPGGQALRQDLGPNVDVALVENAKLSDIDERFTSAIEDLRRGDLSAPVEAEGALHEVYICSVDEGLGIPPRGEIEEKLYSRQLERIAQQYLRDVRRKSTVDVLIDESANQNAAGAGAGAAQPPNG